MGKKISIKTLLAEANDIICNIRYYPKRRTTQRLYKQWAEKSGLQTETPSAEGIKAEITSNHVASANRLSNKPGNSQAAIAETSNPDHFVHQDSTPENIRTRVPDTIGAYVQPNSPEGPRKVAMFMMAEISKEQLRLVILLVLLGASLVIFFLGLIILFVYTLGL